MSDDYRGFLEMAPTRVNAAPARRRARGRRMLDASILLVRRASQSRAPNTALAVAVIAAAVAWIEPALAYSVFVTNEISGDLTIIDGETNRVVETVALGKRPRGMALSPDGRLLYVALSGSPISPPGVDESTLPPADKSADGIGVFSIEERRLERVIRGVSDPEQVTVSADGERLFIASEDTGTAVVASAASGETLATLPVGGEPEGVAITPDGRFVYMTSESDHTVAVIDTAASRVIDLIEVGRRPRQVAFTPDGALGFVTGELDASVLIVDPRSHEVVARLTVPGEGQLPMGLAVAPDGAAFYVTTGRGGMLVAFDTASREATGAVQVGTRPWGVALSPDGRFAYTANGPSDDVSVVATDTMMLLEKIPVGTRPWGVVVVE